MIAKSNIHVFQPKPAFPCEKGSSTWLLSPLNEKNKIRWKQMKVLHALTHLTQND